MSTNTLRATLACLGIVVLVGAACRRDRAAQAGQEPQPAAPASGPGAQSPPPSGSPAESAPPEKRGPTSGSAEQANQANIGNGESGKSMSEAEKKQAQPVLKNVHQINQAEIALGNLAQEKGSNDSVKQYGQMLVSDHEDADRKVMDFADKNGISLSGEAAGASAEKAAPGGAEPAAALPPDQKKTLDKLRGLSGPAFDRQFLVAMVDGHRKALSQVTQARDKTKNEGLKSLLNELAPALEKHLDHARELQRQEGQASSPARPKQQQQQGNGTTP